MAIQNQLDNLCVNFCIKSSTVNIEKNIKKYKNTQCRLLGLQKQYIHTVGHLLANYYIFYCWELTILLHKLCILCTIISNTISRMFIMVY